MVPMGKIFNAFFNFIKTAASFAAFTLTLIFTGNAGAATALHYII